MGMTQAIKKAIGIVARNWRGKVYWVWEKRTLFLPSVRIWKEKWWGRPTAVILTAISAVAFLGLAVPAFADIGSGYVWPAFAYLLEAISALIGQILLWAIDLLIQVSKYNSFLDANVVSVGWVLVRDVANMFFILIMLVIAFGTMLKIEAYSWKKLLPRLILTALLVNFSKTFIGLLIDFSQVIMLTFVNGYAAAAGGNFMSMFQIKELFSSAQNVELKGGDVEFTVLMGFALGTIMLGISLIVILVFVAILLFRIITLWILIVLSPLAFLLGTFPKGQEYYGQWWKQLQGQIIVGPMVAFFLWLSLAALGGGASNTQINYDSSQSADLKAHPSTIDSGTDVGNWDNLASFAVSIAMLLMSLQMIQQLGVTGAGLASGALSAIKSKATAAAKKLAVPAAIGLGMPIAPALGLGAAYGVGAGAWWAGKKGVVGGAKYAAEGVWTKTKAAFYDSKLGGIPAWFTYGTEHRKKELERAQAYAHAKERMRYEKGHFGASPDYLRLEKLKREQEKAKDFGPQYEENVYASDVTLDAMVENFKKTKGGQQLSPEEAGILRGKIRACAEAAYLDDMLDGQGAEWDARRAVLLHDVHGYEYKDKDGQTRYTTDAKISEKYGGQETEEATRRARMTKTSENYRKLIIRGAAGDTSAVDDVLWRSGAEWEDLKNKNPEQYGKDKQKLADWSKGHQAELGLLADMKDIGKKTGHYENMGMSHYDAENKQYTVSTIDKQAEIINAELAKFSLLEKAKINPHSLMTLLGFDGNKPGGMTELGRMILSRWMQGMDETNLSRNLLGRTANLMLGLGPQEEPLKDVNDEGGWVQLNQDYVDNPAGADALRTFLLNPLLLKGLFSKVSGVGPAMISRDLSKFKFVVGEGEQAVEISLKEISDRNGDIASIVRDKKEKGISVSEEHKQEIEHQQKVRDYAEKKEKAVARGEEFTESPPTPPQPAPKPVSQQQAVEAVEPVLTQEFHNLEEMATLAAGGARPAAFTSELEQLFTGLQSSISELPNALKSVIGELSGLKELGKITEKLNGLKIKTGADGNLTSDARVAALLQQLILKDEQIKNILTRLERKSPFKGGDKKGKKDSE